MSKQSTKAIRESLVYQIERRGNAAAHFYDLIDDYIALVGVKNKLEADIKTRGVTVDKVLGDGRVVYTKNESVGELVKVNAQMVKLLEYLKIKPDEDAMMGDDAL